MKAPEIGKYLLTTLVFVLLACTGPATLDEQAMIVPHHPLQTEQDLDALIKQVGDRKIVLLGEASHGTTEYYTWRAAITKRLIQEKGFSIIAVEGEWADSYRVNQFIKGGPKDSLEVNTLLAQYDRWPTWMWGNYEVGRLVHWLNGYNQGKLAASKANFYGLDVYCLWESMEELMPYVRDNDSLALMAKEVMRDTPIWLLLE